MKRKRKTTKKRKPPKVVLPPPKPDPSKTFCTIGVRFLDGPDPYKIFTYQIRRLTSVFVGQELVADTPRGPKLCICVRLDSKYNEEEFPGELKEITRKVMPL